MKNREKRLGLVLIVTVLLTFSYGALKAQAQQDDPKKPPTFEKLLEKMDDNDDGKLSEDEIKGPLKDHFDTVDADGDGFITEEEFKNAPKPERPSK